MKTIAYFFIIIAFIIFLPLFQVFAHTEGSDIPTEMNGEMMDMESTHEDDAETSFSATEAISQTILDNINIVAIFAFIIVVLLGAVLARAFYKKESGA